MSITKKLLAGGISAAVAMSVLPVFAPLTFAKQDERGGDNAEMTLTTAPATSTTSVRDSTRSEENTEVSDNNDSDSATSTEKSSELEKAREERRSEIAKRVQELLSIADRDGGIGEEVREAAREHASSTEKIIEAKDKVDGRPSWMTVIIGSDYKNLGAIRSELATTTNAINRLEKARDRATDPIVRADLEKQILSLSEEASTTAAFVKEHENAFSLLGWFFRMFNK